jgi:hypothetical protein
MGADGNKEGEPVGPAVTMCVPLYGGRDRIVHGNSLLVRVHRKTERRAQNWKQAAARSVPPIAPEPLRGVPGGVGHVHGAGRRHGRHAREQQETSRKSCEDDAKEGDGVEARQGPAPDPDLVVEGDAESFLAVASGRLSLEEAVQAGALRAEGERKEDREALLAWCQSLVGPTAA